MTVLMNLSLVYVLSQNIGGVIFAFDLIQSALYYSLHLESKAHLLQYVGLFLCLF